MAAPIAVTVSHCMECPFCWDGRELEDEIRCTAVDLGDQFRAIGPTQTAAGAWAPIPNWCPLRKADRLVTLVASVDDVAPEGARRARRR